MNHPPIKFIAESRVLIINFLFLCSFCTSHYFKNLSNLYSKSNSNSLLTWFGSGRVVSPPTRPDSNGGSVKDHFSTHRHLPPGPHERCCSQMRQWLCFCQSGGWISRLSHLGLFTEFSSTLCFPLLVPSFPCRIF